MNIEKKLCFLDEQKMSKEHSFFVVFQSYERFLRCGKNIKRRILKMKKINKNQKLVILIAIATIVFIVVACFFLIAQILIMMVVLDL